MESVHPLALMTALLGVTIWHELGHIAAARLLRVPVRHISLGLGPVLWRQPLARDTDLVLRALPLGMSVAVPARQGGAVVRPLSHDLWMAAGGPLASFVLTALLFALARWGGLGADWGLALVGIGLLSAAVALLNLLPLPGLDGGHLLGLALVRSGLCRRDDLYRWMARCGRYGVVLALVVPTVLLWWRL